MAVFRDLNGDEWRIGLDAFVLEEVTKQTGIDLADLSAGGWHRLETDAGACVRVLAVVCGEELRQRKMTTRQFGNAVRREVIEAGLQALLTEGADFFPPRRWSEIQSNLQTRQEAATGAKSLLQITMALESMPPEMRAAAATTVAEMIDQAAKDETAKATNSPTSLGNGSAVGPEVIPLRPVTDSPEPSELLPAG